VLSVTFSLLKFACFCYESFEEICILDCTATKIPFMYSFFGIARLQSQFPHSCVCERFIYSQDQSTYFLQLNRQIDHGTICINRSQTHDCGNWDCGLAIPFLGIFVSSFRYCFLAVCKLSKDVDCY
jgi:hypothetical protein